MLYSVVFFTEKLYTTPPGENETRLPSPEALRERILIKVNDDDNDDANN